MARVAPKAPAPWVDSPAPLVSDKLPMDEPQIGHVHPERTLTFGVVDGHPVDGDIGSGGIGPAHANAGVANAVTRV